MQQPETRDILQAAVVSFRPVWGQTANNVRRIIEFLELAAARGVQLAVFPEMCATGISDDAATDERAKKMQVRCAETVSGPACTAVAEAARRLGVYVVFGMAERDEKDPAVAYNSAVVCGPGGLIGTYRKIHPYDEERLWCTEGDSPFMFDTPWGKVGICICYDTYHFPEMMRYYAASGCRMVLNPTAACNLYREGADNGYEIFLKNAVITNGVFILSANLLGQEQLAPVHGGNNPSRNSVGPTYGGGSVIIGPSNGADNMYRTHLYAGSFKATECGVFDAAIDLGFASRGIYNTNPLSGRADFKPELYAKWYAELAKNS